MDVIDNTGGGFDRLYFAGITKERLGFSREGDDLLVRVDGDLNQSVRVVNHFLGGDASIDMIHPYAGSAIEASELTELIDPQISPNGETAGIGTRYVNSSSEHGSVAATYGDGVAVGSDSIDLNLNSQLDQLVSAMASYNAPAGSGSVVSQDEEKNPQIIVAESWQAVA
jgi:hypothetical protein